MVPFMPVLLEDEVSARWTWLENSNSKPSPAGEWDLWDLKKVMLQLLFHTSIRTRRMKPSKLPCEIFRPVAETQKSPRKLLSFGCSYLLRHLPPRGMQPTQRRTFGTKHGSLDPILCGLPFTASFTSRPSSSKTVWAEQHWYKQLYEGERNQIICPSLSISCRRGVLSKGASRAGGTFAGSTVTQRWIRGRPCLAAGWAGLWQEDEDSKARERANMGMAVPRAGKQNLPKASTLLGTLCHWQSLLISWAPITGASFTSRNCTASTGHNAQCPLARLLPCSAPSWCSQPLKQLISRNLLFKQLFPTLLQPFLSVGPGSQFFLSPHQISLSLWNIQMIWFCSLLPHIKSSPCLWKQWISPRHRRLIYTLQGLK